MYVRSEIQRLNDELLGIRRDLHAHPELGFQEYRTAEVIERHLRALGLEPRRMAGTGVVADLEGGRSDAGPVLLLRADMDALPIQEATGLPYASQTDGVMHACGHDAHTAMLLTAAKVLTEKAAEIPGRIRFLFQPNEEVAGAEKMVAEGALENPRVNAALGVHVWTPLPTGTIGATAGGVMSSMDVFRIVIRGKGGHTGYPESAVDPVIAAADLIQTAQRLQTRDISLLKPTALVFSKISAGTKNNVIPDEAVVEGTLRYLFDPKVDGDEDPPTRLEEILAGVCAVHKCRYDFHVEVENEVVVNAPEMVRLVRETAAEILDDQSRIVEHRSMAGEDFAAYAKRVPSAFIFLGTGNPEKGTDYPHHNPRFNIDEDTMPVGVELLVRTALRFFDEQIDKKRGLS
ncbi:MAG: M20 family metallopeptidase [Spirochaetaceae bacterium]